MNCKYLYIDDNSEHNAKGIITGLQKEGELSVDFDNPKGDWEKERERILSDEFKNYNGLILDLNLEEMPNKDKETSHYKGSSLAQEYRNLSKAGKLKEIPIVLLSATVNLEKYFDRTNEDLFDLIVPREWLNDPILFAPLRQKLISLSIGYELISKCKNEDNNLIELYKYSLELENNRFISEMRSVIGYPTHTVSNFIIKNLLEKSNIPVSGILITEEILATRLGIDISKSIDWKNILENLKKYKYRGVFSEGWERWWMSGIEHWWRTELELKNSLRATSARQKIDLLKDKLELTALVPIEKNEKAKSEAFWTKCVGSGVSIDTVDGLLVDGQDNYYPWQDKKYICYEEALKPKGKHKWKKLSPSEEYKLEILQKQFPNIRPLK
ncbi:hypothetical protein M0M57_11875 [Flavobacterium azooxidireducens]|uniref:Response regulator n=1 Tax=Flavobacterium azooxidireducens TaxID=1871076 RepID=A0ABY4KC09_9FLAO|nr:hypothetical protein [Flavobacterium azooxidireducens]UPQ78317.1 hypothetical protein M0M57_11875 [Flavobacterium azooxidireducens]